MATPASKSVTKSGLSSFLRENATLNLAQAKALTDQLLDTYNISAKPPADPGTITVEAGQTWVHTVTGGNMLVTHVELGPRFVADDPVTIWGPERVHWQSDTATGVVEISPWLEHMQLQEPAPAAATS